MNEVRRAVSSVDSDLPLYQVHTLNYYYTKSMARTSFTLVMLALAGGMALILGIVGRHHGVVHGRADQRQAARSARRVGLDRLDEMAMEVIPAADRSAVPRQGFGLRATGRFNGPAARSGATWGDFGANMPISASHARLGGLSVLGGTTRRCAPVPPQWPFWRGKADGA